MLSVRILQVIKKEQSLVGLQDLALGQAGDYGADMLGSVFDMDAAADLHTGMQSLGTSKVSPKSTSDSYHMSSYQHRPAMPVASTLSPMAVAVTLSPFKHCTDFGFLGDMEFGGERMILPPPAPSRAFSMLPPRPPAPVYTQDRTSMWQHAPAPTLKRVSSAALPYTTSYDEGVDMWARPTKMRSYQSDELPVLDMGAL